MGTEKTWTNTEVTLKRGRIESFTSPLFCAPISNSARCSPKVVDQTPNHWCYRWWPRRHHWHRFLPRLGGTTKDASTFLQLDLGRYNTRTLEPSRVPTLPRTRARSRTRDRGRWIRGTADHYTTGMLRMSGLARRRSCDTRRHHVQSEETVGSSGRRSRRTGDEAGRKGSVLARCGELCVPEFGRRGWSGSQKSRKRTMIG
jgi:hypothetical protein